MGGYQGEKDFMEPANKRVTYLDPNELDSVIGSPAKAYDDLQEQWDTLLYVENDPTAKRAVLILNAMEALIIFMVMPDSEKATEAATGRLNELLAHDGDLGEQRVQQHKRHGGIGASIAYLWNCYQDLIEDETIPRKAK
ncbi:hypothetical protein ACH4VR_36190 [Streptomyces sp. NPDC020883]|uniref:hypothetical protein n=1 Tax=Streptomyces sp. NPDC020883 TaxID=3365099 RepID=UPI0037B56781